MSTCRFLLMTLPSSTSAPSLKATRHQANFCSHRYIKDKLLTHYKHTVYPQASIDLLMKAFQLPVFNYSKLLFHIGRYLTRSSLSQSTTITNIKDLIKSTTSKKPPASKTQPHYATADVLNSCTHCIAFPIHHLHLLHSCAWRNNASSAFARAHVLF